MSLGLDRNYTPVSSQNTSFLLEWQYKEPSFKAFGLKADTP